MKLPTSSLGRHPPGLGSWRLSLSVELMQLRTHSGARSCLLEGLDGASGHPGPAAGAATGYAGRGRRTAETRAGLGWSHVERRLFSSLRALAKCGLVSARADWRIILQDIYSFSNCSASSRVIPMIDATAVGISRSCVVCSNLAILVRVLLML